MKLKFTKDDGPCVIYCKETDRLGSFRFMVSMDGIKFPAKNFGDARKRILEIAADSNISPEGGEIRGTRGVWNIEVV